MQLLLPGDPGADEWGYRGVVDTARERRASLAARTTRYALALALAEDETRPVP